VWIDDSFGPFEAKIDPADRTDFLQPRFTLDTVREIAARSQELASECDYADVDTVHVLDGGTRQGEPRVVVVLVTWQHFDGDPVEVTHIVSPGGDGLYPIGYRNWTWTLAP
jgi:hypothetical protein